MKFYKLSELRTNILKIRVKRKQFKKIIKERGIQLHTKNAVDAENRCRARIWGAGKMITLDDGKVVYGDRCYRRFKDETTKLCFQHSFKNSHGNYDEEPINEIIYNFKKFSVFMKSKN